MYKYNGLRRRQTYDELVDYIIRKHPRQIKHHSRGVLSELGDGYATVITANEIPSVKDKETQKELRTIEQSIQTDVTKMIDKATQTDVFHKGVQVNVKLNPNEYQHRLKAYVGEEVMNYTHWFNWYIKDKATQTSVFTFMDRKESVHPEFTPPPSPVHEKQKPPLYVSMASQLTDTFFTPVNYGLAMVGNSVSNPNELSPLHDSHPVSNINSPASSVTSVIASSRPASRPISVASSRPISVAPSRPVSVHSSPHYPASPESPSYLPAPYEEDSPVSSSSSKSK